MRVADAGDGVCPRSAWTRPLEILILPPCIESEPAVPHSPEEKKRVVTRLRRIQGQALALERAVNEGTECGALLQQLAALRGATNGLMAEVLESHLRETFLQSTQANPPDPRPETESQIDDLMRIVRSYLK